MGIAGEVCFFVGGNMTLETLKQAEKRAVGVNQTTKAIVKGSAEVVFVACDAEERIAAKILALCSEYGVAAVTAETMLDIGRAGGINVKAAAAAILKP